jgi:hypothetical protein
VVSDQKSVSIRATHPAYYILLGLIALNNVRRELQTVKLIVTKHYRCQEFKNQPPCELLIQMNVHTAFGDITDVSVTDQITCGVEVLSERREFRVGQSQVAPDHRSSWLSCLPPHLQTFCTVGFSLSLSLSLSPPLKQA